MENKVETKKIAIRRRYIQNIFTSGAVLTIILIMLFSVSCKKDKTVPEPEPTNNLALDSIRATKKNIIVWEEIYITAYARGQNLSYEWSANHGSMLGADSVTVKYWACPSCLGTNTIECKVSNEYGTVSDTIMITVNP
jgi:hypothetical protein